MSFAVLDELVEGCISVVGVCFPLTLFDILLNLTPLASLEGGMLSNSGISSSSSNSSSITTPSGISWSPTSLNSVLASVLIADDVCLWKSCHLSNSALNLFICSSLNSWTSSSSSSGVEPKSKNGVVAPLGIDELTEDCAFNIPTDVPLAIAVCLNCVCLISSFNLSSSCFFNPKKSTLSN